METKRNTNDRRRAARRQLAGVVLGVGAILVASPAANAATRATFANGKLTVIGDSARNTITISRNAAGRILVNAGAVPVRGGTPAVANTALIEVFGQGGRDRISLDESRGALPKATLFGGGGNDTLTGGSADDQLFGQAGKDTLLGRGGTDFLAGGGGSDTLTGGDGGDQVFGNGGNDRMVWNPGDDTDLNEGGPGLDTVEVNGANGAEEFTAVANGTRVRFDRVDPAPFALDIGTSENLVLAMNGGDDSFSAAGNLAPLITTTVDGGPGGDTILGTNGADRLVGGSGADLIDGQQGNDVAILGGGDDVFRWDPGDGSDTLEGRGGTDTMLFNGSGASEIFDVSADGGRLRFTRNVGSVVMDANHVEVVDVEALGGADTISVNNLRGTDVTRVDAGLAAVGAGGDAQPDTVVLNGTNGEDVVLPSGDASGVVVLGLAPVLSITGAEAADDRLTVNALGDDDVVDASGLAATAIQLTADGGAGNDVLIGGDGNDVLLGGLGDDVLIGGPGLDILDGGPGDNVVIQLTGDDDAVSPATLAGGQ